MDTDPIPVTDTLQKTNLLALDYEGMLAFFRDLGEKPYRAAQVMKWIYHRSVISFADMTDLSKALRARLEETAEIKAPDVITDQVSEDGSRKWLLQLSDGNCIEAVFIPEDDRGTLCVSSQVGCGLNCAFCATARQGYNRNLTVDEIVGQLWRANDALGVVHGEERAISNVVMMGMGEPLLNFDAVISAMHIMRDDNGYGLSKRRVTLSTAGMVPMMDKLKAACDVSLAVSLHAPNDELRNELVPLNRKYDIAELMAACKRYVAGEARRRVTFEYVMLHEVNDKPEHARQLIRLLRDVPAKVNLIPFNPFPDTRYRRSSQARIDRFWKILMDAGLTTITRRTRGDDIDAACGQLAGEFKDRTRRRSQYVQAGGVR